MELIFMTGQSPLVEDHRKWYSRIRFYSDTISKIADFLSCNKVTVLYHHSSLVDNGRVDDDEGSDDMLQDLLKDDPQHFENCCYLMNTTKCPVEFKHIDKYLKETEDKVDTVVLFGILNGIDRNMDQILDKYSKVIELSNYGYHYLSSDAELSKHQYIEPGRISFLSKFADFTNDSVFVNYLRSIIITEITDPNILSAYEFVGISRKRVKYLPMIVNLMQRFTPKSHSSVDRNGRVMMLRNFGLWKQYPELLESFRDRFDIYESSLPAVRKKYIDTVQEYGGNYKVARFWTTERMEEMLSEYSFMLGMSTPTSDRFTYKIIETTNAGAVCILPKINLNAIGYGDSVSQKIIDEYEDIFLIDLESDEAFRSSLSNLGKIFDWTDKEYSDMLVRQYEFVKEYFDSESSNIDALLHDIFRDIIRKESPRV